jgi:hypothetical protein
LALITALMTAVVTLAVIFNYLDSGMSSITWALGAMVIGAILYFPVRKWIKPGIPDVDPYEAPVIE